MLPIVWQSEAIDGLEAIAEYIAQFSPASADELGRLIKGAVAQLPMFPYLYKKGRVPNTREMVVHPNYIVVYRVGLTAVQIVNVLHARQQYPRD